MLLSTWLCHTPAAIPPASVLLPVNETIMTQSAVRRIRGWAQRHGRSEQAKGVMLALPWCQSS